MPITWTLEHDLHLVLFAVTDPYTMDEWRGDGDLESADSYNAAVSRPLAQ